MYNRYIPQPDGSYRRNRIQDPERKQMPLQQPPAPPPPPLPEPEKTPCSGCIHRQTPEKRRQQYQGNPNTSITGFLRQLLPKDFDAEDLMVILLLLLMAGDCREEQNTALLTMALYLFL